MTRLGSDKGQGWHNYTTIYSALFGALRDKPLRIIELGLGTNDPERVSTMGITGRPGASLRGWRDLFPHALVYGADIDRTTLFEEHRIKTFYCDQLDAVAIDELWSQPDLRGGMDIIIDDGLHTLDGNLSFLNASLEQLRPGGFYAIEDIVRAAVKTWHEQLETVYSRRFPNYEFVFVELPNALNDYDNNMVVIRRKEVGTASLS